MMPSQEAVVALADAMNTLGFTACRICNMDDGLDMVAIEVSNENDALRVMTLLLDYMGSPNLIEVAPREMRVRLEHGEWQHLLAFAGVRLVDPLH